MIQEVARETRDAPSGASGARSGEEPNGSVGGLPEADADVPADAIAIPSQSKGKGRLHVSAIIGGDDRANYNHMAATYPYNNHGAMYGGAGTCTGFKLVNHHTMVTAAHCIHTGSAWKSRQTIRFQAGSSSPLPEVSSACYSRFVPGCWDGSSASCDYAVIALRGRLGANCSLDGYDVGYLGWNSVASGVSDVKGFVSGYPSDQLPSGWSYPTLAYHWRNDGWTSDFTYPSRLWFYNDATGGQSGTPFVSWFTSGGWRARAIHKGGGTMVRFTIQTKGAGLRVPWLAGSQPMGVTNDQGAAACGIDGSPFTFLRQRVHGYGVLVGPRCRAASSGGRLGRLKSKGKAGQCGDCVQCSA